MQADASLIATFARIAADRPEQIALITAQSQMSYGDIIDLVHLLDVELSSRGVKPGQTLILDTSRAELCTAFALLLSLRGFSVAYSSLRVALAVGLDFDRAIVLQPTDLANPDRQIVIGPEMFQTLGTLPRPDYTTHKAGKGGVFITQTSGSTGTPKFVLSTEAERLRTVASSAGFVETSMRGRRFATTLLPNTSRAISAGLSVLLSGGSVMMLGDERDKILPYVDLYRVDALSTTPSVLAQILTMPNASQFLTSLRDIRVGGALAAGHLLAAFERICPARIHVSYGAAEIGTMLAYVHDPANPAPSGFLGHPVRQDLEIGFYDPDFVLLPDATEGIAGFRMTDPAMLRRYFGAAGDGDDSGLRGDVFFPGDILRRDNDGYHYIGRIKNIVNFSGNKFSLENIAARLGAAHPKARFALLIETDAHGLERLVLVCARAGTIAADTAQAVLAPLFPGLVITRMVQVDQLPLTASGKVDTEALRAQIVTPEP
ncbi:MAG: AMP-binding protein [Limimaricola sp.]|uniref:AMP-binding protein n=1 Tax=Limimaricola sp. TaxID=2211665 RepID=UPI001D74D2BA|nr:class I adenylate-forming enzyme family protein [Limimaricola sp.]MBI1417861.1 AMP-binding protein [Limimaricola sp.]